MGDSLVPGFLSPFPDLHARSIHDTTIGWCPGRPMSAVSHSRHVCFVTQQAYLPCHTVDMSAVSRSRHVFRVAQQARLLSHTTHISAVSHSRHVCCATQQTCLRQTADMSAVSHYRHVCCVTQHMFAVSHGRHVCCATLPTQQACLLDHTADMSAVSQADMSAAPDMSSASRTRHVCCV